MEPLDPKAELMRLHDEAAQLVASDEHYSTAYRRENVKQSRAALESAITLALAAERRRALEDAAAIVGSKGHWEGKDGRIRALALEEAAKACEKRADDRSYEEGSVDPTTGAWEGPVWVTTANEEDDDCAAAIRALVDGKTT